MMYNDVDTDLPPFNDPIDGDEIFLFSNPKTSTGASFLHEDDDDHLRQHHHHSNNVVASTSSHHIDVDDLLFARNLLDQPSCDTVEDPLFWNCKDISDDQLNEIWPQSQLNLSGNNIGSISSINNINLSINNNNNNHTNDTNSINANTILNQTSIATTSSLSNCNNNISTTQHNGFIINHQQPQSITSLQQHSQQTIIPIQSNQIHGIPTLISQSQLIGQQHQPHQIHVRLHQQQQSEPIVQHQQGFDSVLHSQQQQSGFQHPQQIVQHLDQYQNKWITVVQSNEQYQAFNPVVQDQQISQQQQVLQFFEKAPQAVNQPDNSSTINQTTVNDSTLTVTTQSQPILQPNTQQQLVPSTPEQAPPAQTSKQKGPQQRSQQHSKPPPQKPTTNKTVVKSEPENEDTSKKEAQAKQIKPKERQTRLDCPYCKRSFSKNFDLQQHMRCHTGEKPFQCIVCGRGFAQKSNVKKHMQAHKVWPEGSNNPSMTANHGNARIRNSSASSSVGGSRDDECMQENESVQITEDANYITNDGNALGQSNDRKHDGNDIFAENRYSCSYCQFNGRTYFELKSHLTIHKREKVFKCIVSSCGKTFSGSDLQGFLDHVTGHKDLIYHCHLCSGQFYSLNDFGEHQKHHSNSTLKNKASVAQPSNPLLQQGQTFSKAANASLRQQNQQVVPPTQLQPQQNQQQYNQQSTQVTQQQQQQQSQQQSNNQKSTKVLNSVRPRNNHKYFRCSKCMNRYTTQTALDHHLSISTHNFPCTECNKVFMCERYLRRHLNTHTTVQHVCTFCDKQFKTAAYLKMHSVVHTGEKPFRCNQCEAAFNRRDKLSRHKLTHETVKKFKCPFRPHIGCTKEFNRPDKLKAHVLTHSGVRPHPCDSCTRTFTRLARLREHKKLHHVSDGNLSAKPTNTLTEGEKKATPTSEIDNAKHSDTNNNQNSIKLEVEELA